MSELEHGDAVVVDIMFGAALHWALYDAEKNQFIELSRDSDSFPPRAKIFARSFEDWMELRENANPRRVIWTNGQYLSNDRRDEIVRAARKQIDKVVPYTLLARFNDPEHMNCEAFVRKCHSKTPRSQQADSYRPVLTYAYLALTSVLVLVWVFLSWNPKNIVFASVSIVLLLMLMNNVLYLTIASSSY